MPESDLIKSDRDRTAHNQADFQKKGVIMAKIKKFERVENYLNELRDQGKMSQKDLMKLHFKDLLDRPELEGIGDRTISNALKAFKKALGVLPRENVISKRQKVRNYLDEQLQSGKMTSEELMELRYQDLMERSALKGIGKTTISCTLSIYKKNYEKDVFEDNILSFLDKEKSSDDKDNNKTVTKKKKVQPVTEEVRFSPKEISVLRRMMTQYQENLFHLTEKQDIELRELKLALRYSGIDSRRILEMYWKNKKDVVFPIANLIQNQDSDQFTMESA